MARWVSRSPFPIPESTGTLIPVSDAAIHGQGGPHGTDLLPRDLTDEDFAAAPVLTSLYDLLIEDLTDDEYDSFIDALSS